MMKRNKKKSWRRVFYVWHYTVGLFTSFFLALLAITGILINHSRSIGLDEVDMSFPSVLKWYGMEMSAAELADISQPLITLERIIIDLHSGTIAGVSGPIIMDIAAISLLLLIGTGIFNYMKIRKMQ